MSLLIIGATGTLGRQIVLRAVYEGYQIRCLVRNFRKANFLKEWGVELIYGDLTKPETIPPALKGITAIIDASTSRPNEQSSLQDVDWNGKLYLIEAAKVANIKRYIFFSTQNIEQFQKIPLMKLKYGIESKLKESKIPYTVFRLTGFYQGLVEQYAIPILENLPVWITNENSPIAYMDTQDIAEFCIKSLQLSKTKNQIISLSGIKGWVSIEIINICEKLVGQQAEIRRIPPYLLKFLSGFFGFFEWGESISDRLAFVDILNTSKVDFSKPSDDVYNQFKIDSIQLTKLEDYFLEYYIRLLLRLRDINFEDVQKQKNLIL